MQVRGRKVHVWKLLIKEKKGTSMPSCLAWHTHEQDGIIKSNKKNLQNRGGKKAWNPKSLVSRICSKEKLPAPPQLLVYKPQVVYGFPQAFHDFPAIHPTHEHHLLGLCGNWSWIPYDVYVHTHISYHIISYYVYIYISYLYIKYKYPSIIPWSIMIQVSSLASSSSLVSFTNSMMGSASPGKAGSAGSADADADAKGFKGLLSWSSRGMINIWGSRHRLCIYIYI